jgi:3-dehydroquinate synthase
MTDAKVAVGLGERAYDIVIGDGLLDRAGAHLKPLLARPRAFVVTDENVAAAQGARLGLALDEAGISSERIVLRPGEATKSFAELQALVERLIALGVERSDLIVAFGGGVIGDMAGFAAAIVKRGCRYAQLPTTLLAQADSAIGGKTAINSVYGKNLVGAFHQPAIVLSDIAALKTLPDREMRAGFAEVLKYGALGDPAFFVWLEENAPAVLSGEAAAVAHAVKRSCEMKAAIVAEDEREQGRRALLNLGHTFAHALESAAGHSDKLLHGEAVAAGMALAFDYSAARGLCGPADARRVKALLQRASLPTSLAEVPAARGLSGRDLAALMQSDKKARGAALTLILAKGIGAAFIERATDGPALEAFLDMKAGEAGP